MRGETLPDQRLNSSLLEGPARETQGQRAQQTPEDQWRYYTLILAKRPRCICETTGSVSLAWSEQTSLIFFLDRLGGIKCGEPFRLPKTSPLVGCVSFRQVLFFFALRHVGKFSLIHKSEVCSNTVIKQPVYISYLICVLVRLARLSLTQFL